MPHPVGHIEIPRLVLNVKRSFQYPVNFIKPRLAVNFLTDLRAADIAHKIHKSGGKRQRRRSAFRTEYTAEPAHGKKPRQLAVIGSAAAKYKITVKSGYKGVPVLPVKAAEVIPRAVCLLQGPYLLRLNALCGERRKILGGAYARYHSSAAAFSICSARAFAAP